ncbi:MAG TPA: T9SS type A sorting domain-containing protein, partial [Rhodothermales bacterium]
ELPAGIALDGNYPNPFNPSTTLRYADSTAANGTVWTERFDFSVDSTGAIRYGSRALSIQTEMPGAVEAAVSLKGASTPADPTDVDEGYQIEIAIDLVQALGYTEVAGGQLWTAMNFLDGDFLESASDSYVMRTWINTERGGGGEGAAIYGFLDPTPIGTAAEAPNELPAGIALDGNYPNPFNPSTTLRYALPQGGDVTVQVFDVLGRQVAIYAAGFQSAGQNEFRLNAANLASGMYVYRLQVSDVASGAVRHSAVGQMVLVK